MFTGLVQAIGTIVSSKKTDNLVRVTIKCPWLKCKIGESISVDGVCLTVHKWYPWHFVAYIIPETQLSTNLNFKNLKIKQQVNLERSLRGSDQFGGHFVSGHVDKKLKIKGINSSIGKDIAVQAEACDLVFLSTKGSITINGVSLTIQSMKNDVFYVSLIPKTLATTNMGNLQINDSVNIEWDLFAKIVHHQLSIKKADL
ncbi:riboflavin synthase [Gammaproteobacteria bacterium]|nr:riboflavin synthase [Gammaproteobacteria bacterium]